MKTLKPIRTYQHQAVEDADLTLNSILDLIVEGTWDWNGRTGEVLRSPGWFRMLGYNVGVFHDDVFTWENLIHPDDYERVMSNFECFTSGQVGVYCVDYRCRKAEGDYLWITDRAHVVERDEDGNVCRIIGAHLNIHDRKLAQLELIEQNRLLKAGNLTLEKRLVIKAKELERRNAELQAKIAEIEHISNTDPLTQIANRKKFEAELVREKARADRYQHPLSLAIFDIDHFKAVNDTHGHHVGDEVLKSLAQLVADNIRDLDFFARWGGEEFVLIFPSISLEGACECTEKLRSLISQVEMAPGISITCSFGVTEYQAGDSIEKLFTWIDNALYMAKNTGRNRVEVFTSDHSPT